MTTRNAEAIWTGEIKSGKGQMKLGSGACEVPFSFGTRFESTPGTNPEELIGAALAGCYSMALSGDLGRAGRTPRQIRTRAGVTIERTGSGFGITRILLETEADVPELGDAEFQRLASETAKNCPVARALGAVEIQLRATLRVL